MCVCVCERQTDRQTDRQREADRQRCLLVVFVLALEIKEMGAGVKPDERSNRRSRVSKLKTFP